MVSSVRRQFRGRAIAQQTGRRRILQDWFVQNVMQDLTFTQSYEVLLYINMGFCFAQMILSDFISLHFLISFYLLYHAHKTQMKTHFPPLPISTLTPFPAQDIHSHKAKLSLSYCYTEFYDSLSFIASVFSLIPKDVWIVALWPLPNAGGQRSLSSLWI